MTKRDCGDCPMVQVRLEKAYCRLMGKYLKVIERCSNAKPKSAKLG